MIGERLREERERLGFNQPDFANFAGVSKRTLIDWEKSSTSPNAVQLSSLNEIGVDVGYVITGERKHLNVAELPDGYDGFSLVPVHDEVLISAGHGSVICSNPEPSNFMAFRNDWIRSRGFLVKDLKVFITRGDSMIPTIEDKEPILVNTGEKEPQDGHIYVIRSGEMTWVKRIQRLIDGALLLISDNKLYPAMSIKLDESNDVEVIGKVVNSSKNFY